MTATAQSPGIQQRIYLAGIPMLRPAASIGEVPQRAGTFERMADSFPVVDRPYLPITNPPDVVVKHVWTLAFPRVGETDYRAFARAEALPGFVDFCLWKPISEIFSGDGSSKTFSLLRRNALSQVSPLPPNAATIYAVQAWVGGVSVTAPSFGSPDARTGVTAATFADAPTGGSSNVEIYYVPLYYAWVDSISRDFPTVHRETRALTLVEA